MTAEPNKIPWDQVQWRNTKSGYRAFLRGKEVVWAPQPGAQAAFLECPAFEVLIEGNRGGGKTDALLMDFAQHVGRGWGMDWRGILFRQTYKQLHDVVSKTRDFFHRIFPDAKFNESKMEWSWPTGEMLVLSYLEREEDYWNYHGHEYPWIGWEELTTWKDDRCYRVMMACCRSRKVGMPRKYRGTTNPYGPGHNWVKARFRLPIAPGQVCGPLVEDSGEPARIAIHCSLDDNQVLMLAEPDYKRRISAAASNEAQRKAWLDGSWDIVAGGMFDDLWDPKTHVIPDMDLRRIPSRWRINRAYDHGQSHPFSVGWWAESNGEPVQVEGRTIGAVRGDLIRIAEWYGWNGSPNDGKRMLAVDIAQGIVAREQEWGVHGRVRPGPADSSIFDDYEPGKSVAGDMAKRGVSWLPADKKAGSRKQGWQQLRKLLAGSVPGKEGAREFPGLFVCRRCAQFVRTVPVLPRDPTDLDDVNSDAEDHVADEARYRVREKNRKAGEIPW